MRKGPEIPEIPKIQGIQGTPSDQDQIVLSSSVTDLEYWKEEFLKNLEKKQKSFNTLRNYRADLHGLQIYFKSKGLEDNINNLTPKKIQEYAEFLYKEYPSSNTRRRRLQALRIFLDFLVEKNMMAQNPLLKILSAPKILDFPVPTPMSHILLAWNYLQAKIHQDDTLRHQVVALRNALIFLLIYEAGAKVSDLTHLKKSHIFLSEEQTRVLFTPEKRDPYSVPVSRTFFHLAQIYLKSLAHLQSSEQDNILFDEFFFNANAYKILAGGITPRGIELLFEDFKEVKGDLRPRNLRQSCVIKWLQQGVSDHTVKTWLGLSKNYSLKMYHEVQAKMTQNGEIFTELTLNDTNLVLPIT